MPGQHCETTVTSPKTGAQRTLQTKEPPKAYCMAADNSWSYPTSSSAGWALSPAILRAAATALGGTSREDTCSSQAD